MKMIKIAFIALIFGVLSLNAKAEYPADDILFFTDKLSAKLGINVDSCSNLFLMASISNWIGTPYRYGQNTEKGTDCSGFVGNIYKSVFCLNTNRSSSGIYDQTQVKLKKEELVEGDLVFFKIRGNRVSHVGIYLKDGYFAHASTHRGVIISNLEEAYYKKYWYAGGRIV